MKRKIFTTILSVLFLCCLSLGLTACGLFIRTPNSGAGGYTHKQVGDFEFSVSTDTNEAELTKYTGTSENVVIPNSVDGVPVTAIANYTFNEYDDYNSIRNGIKIKSVVVPDSVTKIEDNTFGGLPLESVTLSNNLQEIGDRLFSTCYFLKNLTLPSNLKTIGKSAFSCCYGLETLVIPEGVTTIEEDAFFECSNLMQIILPSTLTGNMEFAEFENCYRLVEIINKSNFTFSTFDTGVNPLRILTSDEPSTSNFITIDDCVYYQADDGVYLINYRGDKTSLTLPNNVNGNGFTVRAYAFHDYGNIDYDILCPVQFLDLGGATKVQEKAFNGEKLLQLIIRESVTDFPTYSLNRRVAEVINLSSIEFDDDDEWWARGGRLSYAKYLKDIPTISNFITQDNAIFYKNASNYYLVAITPEDIENITLPRTTFTYECRVDLAYTTTVTIPNCVKLHQEDYDETYKSINHIILEDGITEIPRYAFSYFWIVTITIPNSVTIIGENAFYGNSTTIIAEEGSYAQTYATENNLKFQAKQ